MRAAFSSHLSPKQRTNIAILVAALGYFVDVYDLILFSVVRVESLRSLGLNPEQILSDGVFLLNSQLVGLLVGGVLWGVWGDKKGRIQVLFGSILLYSLANIANAFVTDVWQYAALRFIAGVGLAGEIGAGITLVAELMPKESRGYGTTIVATVGVLGGVCASIVGQWFDWRTSYMIGGVMGLCLLLLRVSVHESGMFSKLSDHAHVSRGDLKLLFSSKERVGRYLCCILVGTPIWYAVGIIITFSPEIGRALGITETIIPGNAVLAFYIGITAGDLLSGLLSQYLKSRRKAIGLFLGSTTITSLIILSGIPTSAQSYYYWCVPLGLAAGYWAVFVTTAAEQFGTNLRATVATTAPNFVRGTAVLQTMMFEYLKGPIGAVMSAEVVGVVVFIVAALALLRLRETYGTDLNFLEEHAP